MNWTEFIKRKGIGFNMTWRWGKQKDFEPVCIKCKGRKSRHWIERHEFEEERRQNEQNT